MDRIAPSLRHLFSAKDFEEMEKRRHTDKSSLELRLEVIKSKTERQRAREKEKIERELMKARIEERKRMKQELRSHTLTEAKRIASKYADHRKHDPEWEEGQDEDSDYTESESESESESERTTEPPTDLELLTRTELFELGQRMDLEVYSSWSKPKLVYEVEKGLERMK